MCWIAGQQYSIETTIKNPPDKCKENRYDCKFYLYCNYLTFYEFAMQTAPSFPSPTLLGAIKTFGVFGPAYQVIEALRQLADGDWMMRVRLVETSEEVEYRYTRVLDDPKAI